MQNVSVFKKLYSVAIFIIFPLKKGVIEPGVGTFYRIIKVLGLRVDIVKPVY
jgi:hypothetical protein